MAMKRKAAIIKGSVSPQSELVIDVQESGVIFRVMYGGDHNLAISVPRENLESALKKLGIIDLPPYDNRLSRIEDTLNKINQGLIREYEFIFHVKEILHPYTFPTNHAAVITAQAKGNTFGPRARFTRIGEVWVDDDGLNYSQQSMESNWHDFNTIANGLSSD